MRMNRKAALFASATLGVAFLAACSDSPVSPTQKAFVPKSNFVVNAVTNNTPVVGVLKICKLGNVGGTFAVGTNQAGQGGTGNPSIQNPITVATGECRIAAEDNGDSNLLKGDFFQVSENAAANTVQTLTSCVGVEGPIACNNNYFVNNVHGVVLTYTNTFTPPSTGCTFTKGYYRNHDSAVKAEDGRTLAQTIAILDATPGQPGPVTFGGDNSLLNLYQQYLTALINLNGAQAPAGVAAALAAVAAGTDGSGFNITTTLTQQQISDLTDVLDNFNNGNLAGWPHC